ncbi:hypothetical protein LINPERHAP2_LOCUS42255, partial [Linum perenne]
PKPVFEEPKTHLGQSLIPGVVELRLTIRFLLHVRRGERKRLLVVVLAGSEQAAVRGRRKSYVFVAQPEISKTSNLDSESCRYPIGDPFLAMSSL